MKHVQTIGIRLSVKSTISLGLALDMLSFVQNSGSLDLGLRSELAHHPIRIYEQYLLRRVKDLPRRLNTHLQFPIRPVE